MISDRLQRHAASLYPEARFTELATHSCSCTIDPLLNSLLGMHVSGASSMPSARATVFRRLAGWFAPELVREQDEAGAVQTEAVQPSDAGKRYALHGAVHAAFKQANDAEHFFIEEVLAQSAILLLTRSNRHDQVKEQVETLRRQHAGLATAIGALATSPDKDADLNRLREQIRSHGNYENLLFSYLARLIS